MLIQPVVLLEKGPDGTLRPFTAHMPDVLDHPYDRAMGPQTRMAEAPSVGPLPSSSLSVRMDDARRSKEAEASAVAADADAGAPPKKQDHHHHQSTPKKSVVPCASSVGHTASPLVDEIKGSEDDWFKVSMEHVKMRDGTFESDVPVQAMAELFNCHFNVVSQVNPHIIPFFHSARGSDGRPSTWRLWAGGWRGGFVLSALELWLREDMLKNLRFLAGLDLLIEVFGVDWSYLWLQEARGDVTIIPSVRFLDYLSLIDNLSSPRELHYKVRKWGKQLFWWSGSCVCKRVMILVGGACPQVNAMEKTAWQSVSRIEKRLMVQNALDASCERLGIPSDL